MKNIWSNFKGGVRKIGLPVALASFIPFSGCGSEKPKDTRNSSSQVLNFRRTNFIESARRVVFDKNDFLYDGRKGVVYYDIDKDIKTHSEKECDEFLKNNPDKNFYDWEGDKGDILFDRGYDVELSPFIIDRGVSISSPRLRDSRSRSFLFFGGDELRDEHGDLALERILWKIPRQGYWDMCSMSDKLNYMGERKSYGVFVKTGEGNCYLLERVLYRNEFNSAPYLEGEGSSSKNFFSRMVSSGADSPKIVLDIYKLNNSKVPEYSPYPKD